ncbi:MAG: WD40 repeat domain-containing protein [Dehalococcoidia bacterium]
MASVYLFDGDQLRGIASPESARRLRWAAWRPHGEYALLVGNRGQVFRFDEGRFDDLPSQSSHNLRGAAWSPDGALALLAGNRGAVLLYDGQRFHELPSVTAENLRRVAWAPDNSCALIIGNGGVVLRFDRDTGALLPLPGDRAHTMRSIAWRPDGAYALIGAYSSAYAGYPRPHMLYRCDGRYTQALLATDDQDDAVAIAFRPGTQPPRALVLSVAYRDNDAVANKLFEYDGSTFATTPVEAPAALLGAAWRPDGAHALICGERGALFRYDGRSIDALASNTNDNLVGPFWRPGEASALVLKGPDERVYTV